MNCPLCDTGRPARPVLRAHDRDLVRCGGCGLVRVDPFPSAGAALALYDTAYFSDAQRGYVDYVADEAVFRAEFRRRLRTIRAAGGGGALLDVGCASGALLDEARKAGFAASGIEPADEMARRAADRTGCPVLSASLDDALLSPAHYGVVTLFDVLEHLVNPVGALDKLRAALRPGGLLAATVPDFGGWWARLSGRHWPFITPWEHTLYFTRRTLRRVLGAAGFEHVHFHAARTPLSFATLTLRARVPLLRGAVPASVRHRGLGLPFGTLLALAHAPRSSRHDA